MNNLRPAAMLLTMLTLLTGFLYPLGVTVAAHLFWPEHADGTLVSRSGHLVGSKLIGQHFQDSRYFWGRPSDTTPQPYQAQASSASNLSPFSQAFQKRAGVRLRTVQDSDAGSTGAVPVELITASGSGLDPHISPQGAYYQASRVARARSLSIQEVRDLIDSHTEPPTWGFLGQPRVNVLMLNLALDEASGGGARVSSGGE